ncbi:MAG: dihydrolipoamide acetyltransferase family protein [Saprospiraceae bacterium]
MAQVELIMPKMGESIMEATILKWVKNVGDTIEEDETILEIATDKVDSEVPSPTSGVLAKILFKEDDVVPIGEVIAIIATEGETVNVSPSPAVKETPDANNNVHNPSTAPARTPAPAMATVGTGSNNDERFYSPLVKNIAAKENISTVELATIHGSGSGGRVTKKDILSYINNRSTAPQQPLQTQPVTPLQTTSSPRATIPAKSGQAAPTKSYGDNVEIVQMDRMRRLIADHMVRSKHTSPHVTSFIEVDVTDIVNWRNRVKQEFQQKHGEKITFTPIFMEAVVKALTDFPLINVSVDGDKIIVKKDLNIGMATALPSGNLIVPVIKNADQKNLLGLTKSVNGLAKRARENKLKPDETQGGTFTLTNVGTFGNVMGTPIINQPQVAILAVGAIRKKPAVIETEYGDVIAIRQMMFMSLSYDHRVVDGFLGGSFLRRIGDYMEAFDTKQTV